MRNCFNYCLLHNDLLLLQIIVGYEVSNVHGYSEENTRQTWITDFIILVIQAVLRLQGSLTTRISK